jgi:aldose 1-epimerase
MDTAHPEESVQIREGNLAVSIATSFGNNAHSMVLEGREYLWKPRPTVAEWRANPASGGIPILAPWANRLDRDAFFANGKEYRLNPGLGNLRRDQNHLPIHGLIAYAADWRILQRDASSVTSRLEFWRNPDWMAQFPFAHALEVTHRLSQGSLEIETVVENLADQPMPLSLGYHPYLQLTDSPRDEWKLHLAARERVVLSDKLVPTGAREPVAQRDLAPLAGHALDDGFTSLTGEEFSVAGPKQRIGVRFGPRYPVAVVWTPPGHPYLAIEPMTAQTNAFNLTQAGVNAGLQIIPPRSTWRESFWITPSI